MAFLNPAFRVQRLSYQRSIFPVYARLLAEHLLLRRRVSGIKASDAALALCLLFLQSSVASDETNENSRKFPSGMYRIVNPALGTWARNLPGPGHQGPWRSSIVMTTQFSSVYQTWEVTPDEEGYRIRNYGSSNSAFSTGHAEDPVIGFSDGFTKWYIEPAGGDNYRIHYPNRDLIWTVRPNEFSLDTISLEPAQGAEGQVFQFIES
ncbi:hypothetical protein AN958_09571 [Leucoagaricus sp. SymC.cos]|nr:hypothetical protein AN958_09571 [Leucoagaricus sp. SymC.cos]